MATAEPTALAQVATDVPFARPASSSMRSQILGAATGAVGVAGSAAGVANLAASFPCKEEISASESAPSKNISSRTSKLANGLAGSHDLPM